ncbi:endonuclease [Alcanivorax limicola]|uniref:endonuclease n=1 Tax=Alcanivorax limicola TaxID=2874102 RepID=UPI001CBEC617|nr:endonuclease [Alcanivorax limicola]
MHPLSLPGLAILLPALLCWSTPSQAEPSADDLFIEQVYAEGGQTLYCATPFMPGDRVRIERIYPDRQLLQHAGCTHARLCRNNADYLRASNDMHHMFPVERQSDLDRRGALFGELRSGVPTSERCGYRLGFQTFEPPEAVRGIVARAMMYMHVEHDVPLAGSYEMFLRWHEESPPETAERERNALIGEIQGNRNPFIDNPASMRNVPPPSPF